MLRRATALTALVAVFGCNLDTDREAPYVAPPDEPGTCGTTASLFPRLISFAEEERLAPLREVLLSRLATTPENPLPDPSLRVVLNALVRLVSQLGLDKTQDIATIAARAELQEELSPILVLLLEFLDGRIDGRDHYDAAEAGAHFVRVCNPDYLLTSIELLLRFQSPSYGKPWIVAVLEALRPIVANPTLQPFLEGFERESEQGRPAIVSLLVQIMSFVADEGFSISRVRTLLDSAVYPAVDQDLEDQIEVLVLLLDEATTPEAGLFEPLQQAMRCGMQHQDERDALLGLVYDLLTSGAIDPSEIVDTGSDILQSDALVPELSLLADTVRIVRTDTVIRDDLRELLALLLTRPDVEKVVPVLIELVDEKVVAELLDGLVVLLSGCGR